MAAANLKVWKVTHDFASVAANTSAGDTVTVTGVKLGVDHYVGMEIDESVLNDGLGIGGGEVTADNTITVKVQNSTGGALNPASQTLYITTIAYSGDDQGASGGPAWAG